MGNFRDETVLPILIPVHNIAHQLMPINLLAQRRSAYRAQGNGVLSRLTPLKHTNRFMLAASMELEMIWFQGATLP